MSVYEEYVKYYYTTINSQLNSHLIGDISSIIDSYLTVTYGNEWILFVDRLVKLDKSKNLLITPHTTAKINSIDNKYALLPIRRTVKSIVSLVDHINNDHTFVRISSDYSTARAINLRIEVTFVEMAESYVYLEFTSLDLDDIYRIITAECKIREMYDSLQAHDINEIADSIVAVIYCTGKLSKYKE